MDKGMDSAVHTTWKNPLKSGRRGTLIGCILRTAGVVLVIAGPCSGSRGVLWMGVGVFVLAWLTSVTSRALFRSNCRQLYKLETASTDGEDPSTILPGVSLIAPARNEEEGVEAAARSWAALDYPVLEVLIVNDHSTDGTRRILDSLEPTFPQLRVIHDPPLQEGWLGKANAVWCAVQQANPDHKWLLLTDGDVLFHPKTLRLAVAYAEANKLDFLTCVPALDNGTFAEELVLSQVWRDLIIAAAPSLLNLPKARPFGIGAFILVTRQAYLASGGHSAICDQQPEDTLLGGVVKSWGGTIGAAWTSGMVRVRLYRGYRQLRHTLVRKTRVLADDSISELVSRLGYFLIMQVLPLPLGLAALAMLPTHSMLAWPLAAYSLAALATYIDGVRAVRQAREIAVMRPAAAWLHPLAGLVRVEILLSALGQVLFRTRMNWRGRPFTNARVDSKTQHTSS